MPQTPARAGVCAAGHNRLLAGSYVPHVGRELAFALTPRVAQIEQRLRDAIRLGRLAPVPQSLAELAAWNESAQQRRLIDEDERKMLDDCARYAVEAVEVDDFPADFGLLADLQRRKEALDKAMDLAA